MKCLGRRSVLGFILTMTPLAMGFFSSPTLAQDATSSERLVFEPLPNLPDRLGVAGPLVGVHNGVLIVAGGANFASADDPALWELPKKYYDQIWVLERTVDDGFEWRDDVGDVRLPESIGYSAVVSTPHGVLCLGGQNGSGLSRRTILLRWGVDSWKLSVLDKAIPDLPSPCTAGGAALIGDFVYLVAGQVADSDGNLAASRIVWRLPLSVLESATPDGTSTVEWEPVVGMPKSGPRKMYALVTAQHDGFGKRLYVLGGRHFEDPSDTTDEGTLKFCSDCWSFNPDQYDAAKFDAATGDYAGPSPWKQLADAPVPVTAGTAVPYGPAHVIIPAYATGEVLRDQLDTGKPMKEFAHPGFPKTALAYHTVTDTWTEFGDMPPAQVTTPAVRWGDDIMLISGEVQPRVRTNKAWRIRVAETKPPFGIINLAVVAAYLLGMVGIGGYFMVRSKTTDDYFRGGKSVPWWAAGCSIFATMLSSITYMAVPAKAFAQDWVYALGNLIIFCVAPVAIYVALPFFRALDATSAYEYLEKRFNRTVRLIGSGSFSLFHVFRMAVVLALAALALASVTPLTPSQCVLVMGILSIIYCTLGGIEAVIWTDTVQTFILLGGALLCLFIALGGADAGSVAAATEAGKFHLLNFDFSRDSFTTMAVWLVILGGAGQNLASYTADQAVVQRYMTTPDQKAAARSIWLNGIMAIPAGAIFFGLGTALWMFYRSQPEKLDPTIAADRILPLFISNELPVGVAGLVVAGIFAAAQSTVSTSMNSGATTIVTDFLRPIGFSKTEAGYLWWARAITLAMGVLGTVAGLYFVDPDIKSLFDEFVGILGMFLGVLAGLFALGATTRRANSAGSLIGAVVGLVTVMWIAFAAKDKTYLGICFRDLFDALGSDVYRVHSYLYAFIGIVVCFVVGYLASLAFAKPSKPLVGLTLWDGVEVSRGAAETQR